MQRLKIVIIGCGRISKSHIKAINNNEDSCFLTAVSDIIPERMTSVSDEYSLENVNCYIDYREMLDCEQPDIASICTESGNHAKIAMDCLGRGINVLVEKPMALKLKDADEMISCAEKNNVKLGVCHQNRFNPAIQKLRRAIDEERFGRIVNGTARILWKRDENYYRQAPWRGTWAMDGGTLMNQCIHNIDLLQWMMGGEIKSVYGQTGRYLNNIEAEDFGAILIRFDNGGIGLVEGSACIYPKNLEESLSIFGEKGTVVIGGLAVNEIKTWLFDDKKDYDNEDGSQHIESVYGEGHTPLYKDFVSAIKNNNTPYIDGREGKKALSIILKVYEQEGNVCG